MHKILFTLLALAIPAVATRHLKSGEEYWGEYPRTALMANIQGDVILALEVDPKGDIKSMRVERADADILGREAIKMMKATKRRFEGAQRQRRTHERVTFIVNYIISPDVASSYSWFDGFNNVIKFYAPPPIALRQPFTSFH